MNLSVVIPVYNVRDYISQCLDSVCVAVQKLQEASVVSDFCAEMICVDDGSTDGSGDLLDAYQVEKSELLSRTKISLRVIHQKNTGVSGARNAALDVANGYWVTMLDADDQFEPDAFSCVFTEISKYSDVDGVVVRVRLCDETGFVNGTYEKITELNKIVSGNYLIQSPYSSSCGGKFYRRSILDQYNLRFTDGMKVGEDTLFAHKFFAYAGKIALLGSVLGYRYYMRSQSVVHSKYNQMIQDPYRLFRELHLVWRETNVKELRDYLVAIGSGALAICKDSYYSSDARKEAFKFMLNSHDLRHLIYPFLMRYGKVKTKLIFTLYFILPLRLKRKLLNRLYGDEL